MNNQKEPMTLHAKDALDDFPDLKRDADEFESWMLKKQEEISSLMNSEKSLEEMMKTHSIIERELTERSKDLITFHTATNPQNFANLEANERIEELFILWSYLKATIYTTRSKLEQQTKEMEEFNRLCDEVMSWIKKTKTLVFVMIDNDDHDRDSSWKRDFAEIKDEIINSQGNRVTELHDLAATLLMQQHPDSTAILRRRSVLDHYWVRLRRLVDEAPKMDKPSEAKKVEGFLALLSETLFQLEDSEAVLSNIEFCQDVADVERLQRALDDTERDFAALERRVSRLSHRASLIENSLTVECFRLTIQTKRAELLHQWLELNTMAKRRRIYLEQLHRLHRLLADCQNLEAWMREMRASISAEELPRNVDGARALLTRHCERKVELDARIKAIALAKAKVHKNEFCALPELSRKLTSLDQLTENFLELWQDKLSFYKYWVDLQNVYSVLATQMLTLGCNLKVKREEADGSLASLKMKIDDLSENAKWLIESGNLAMEDPAQHQQKLIHIYENLKTLAASKQSDFNASMQLKQDSHALITWIVNKLEYAKDESYDIKRFPYPPSLNYILQQQQDFEEELKAHEPRVMELLSHKDESLAQTKEIAELWESLKTASELKAARLREIDEKRRYYWAVEDIERQLCEVEDELRGEVCSEVLDQRGNVNERCDNINSILTNTGERIEAYARTVRRLVKEGHREVMVIRQKQEELQLRHRNLQCLMPAYLKCQEANGQHFNRQKLNSFSHNLQSHEDWIREVSYYVVSLCDSDVGRDHIQLQKQLKEHRDLLAKIGEHEALYDNLRETGAYIAELNTGLCKSETDKLCQRVEDLYTRVGQLKIKLQSHEDVLEYSYQCLQYFYDATAIEDWLSQMSLQFATVTDCGEDKDGNVALLAKHEDKLNLFKASATKIVWLRKQARACREKRVLYETRKLDSWSCPLLTKPIKLTNLGLINARQSQIEEQYETLYTLMRQRRDKVKEALKFCKSTLEKNIDHENQPQNVDHENQQQNVDHQNQQQNVDHENRAQNADHENRPENVDHENRQQKDDHEKQLAQNVDHENQQQNVNHQNQQQNVDYENRPQNVDHENRPQNVDHENRLQNGDHENRQENIDHENLQQNISKILQQENVDEVQQQKKFDDDLQVPKRVDEDLQTEYVFVSPAGVDEPIVPDNLPIVRQQGDDLVRLEILPGGNTTRRLEILPGESQMSQVNGLAADEAPQPLDQPSPRDDELTKNEMLSSLNVDQSAAQESPIQSCSCLNVSHDTMRRLAKDAEMVSKWIVGKLQLESDDIISIINDAKDVGDSNLECRILQERIERARVLIERWRVQISNEISEVESWVEERIKRLAGSDDCGSDLASVQSLRNSHKDLEAELQSYEPNVRTILEAGETLPDDEKPNFVPRLELLQQAWSRLQELAATRRRKLDESLVRQLDLLAKDDEKDESDEDTSDAVWSILDEYNADFEATTSSLL